MSSVSSRVVSCLPVLVSSFLCLGVVRLPVMSQGKDTTYVDMQH